MDTMTYQGIDVAGKEFFRARHAPSKTRCRRRKNVGQLERLASLVGGAALGVTALQRGRPWLAVLGGGLLYRGITGYCAGYRALGINGAEQNSATAVPAQQGCKVEKSITINRAADEIFRTWRELSSLPLFMRHLRAVTVLDDRQSHWTAFGPAGRELQWDAEIINERENELLAWRSLPGGDIDTAGSIRLEPLSHERGTVATVSLKYNPPGGAVVAHLAEWFGTGLESKLSEDLRRFKQYLETGEIATTEGQTSGRTSTRCVRS